MWKEGWTYGNELGADELGDFEKIAAVARNPEEECDRVADIADDEFNGQGGIINVEIPAPPGKETVCQAQKRKDAEEICENHPRDL